jgi:hypothetical protein
MPPVRSLSNVPAIQHVAALAAYERGGQRRSRDGPVAAEHPGEQVIDVAVYESETGVR